MLPIITRTYKRFCLVNGTYIEKQPTWSGGMHHSLHMALSKKHLTPADKCDTCGKVLDSSTEYYFCTPCGEEEKRSLQGGTCEGFTDMEEQWFRGRVCGAEVVEVINLITEDDIVGEVDAGHTCSMCSYNDTDVDAFCTVGDNVSGMRLMCRDEDACITRTHNQNNAPTGRTFHCMNLECGYSGTCEEVSASTFTMSVCPQCGFAEG